MDPKLNERELQLASLARQGVGNAGMHVTRMEEERIGPLIDALFQASAKVMEESEPEGGMTLQEWTAVVLSVALSLLETQLDFAWETGQLESPKEKFNGWYWSGVVTTFVAHVGHVSGVPVEFVARDSAP